MRGEHLGVERDTEASASATNAPSTNAGRAPPTTSK
jgi:hypothetical protein